MKTALAFAAVACAASAASANVIGVALGTSRVSTMGPFDMTPFADDPRGGFAPVDYIDAPLGGKVTITPTMAACDIGTDWGTWSGGYTGTVYWTQGGVNAVINLPEQTGAFVFYAEPNPFEVYTVRAISADGTQITQDIDGSGGASGYGFYTDDGTPLSSIVVTSDADFALGEFSIAMVPTPASAGLLGLGALATGRRRRR